MPTQVNIERFIAIPPKLLCFSLSAQASAWSNWLGEQQCTTPASRRPSVVSWRSLREHLV